MYPDWVSLTNAITLAPDAGMKATNCSVHVSVVAEKDATLYIQLRKAIPWNLVNATYLGLYFRGSAIANGGYSLILLLSTDEGFSSYYVYQTQDVSLWDGRIHGILIPTDDFQRVGSPRWNMIRSLDIGVYSSQGGNFDYNFEYLVSAKCSSANC
jgi:hypothetical protein